VARKTTAADLTLVPCQCTTHERLPDGTPTEWVPTPREAALAVRRHVVDEALYWAVHWLPPNDENYHVVSVVLDGLRYGPGGPTPA